MRRLQGWTEIADFMQRSEKWCWRASKLPIGERLPCYKLGGMIVAEADDLEAWRLERKVRDVGSAVPYGR